MAGLEAAKKPASPCEDAGLLRVEEGDRNVATASSVTGDSGGFGLLGLLVAEPGAA